MKQLNHGEKIAIQIAAEDHIIFGGSRIAKIIKRDKDEIASLVKSGKLRAVKVGEKGKWRALCSDLFDFNVRQMDELLSDFDSKNE